MRAQDAPGSYVVFANPVCSCPTMQEADVVRMVEAVCSVGATATHADDVAACLSFLDVLVRYGVVPQACLRPYVQTLCRTVNMDEYVHTSAHTSAARLRPSRMRPPPPIPTPTRIPAPTPTRTQPHLTRTPAPIPLQVQHDKLADHA